MRLHERLILVISNQLAGAWKGAKELEVSKILSKQGAKELPPGFQAHLGQDH